MTTHTAGRCDNWGLIFSSHYHTRDREWRWTESEEKPGKVKDKTLKLTGIVTRVERNRKRKSFMVFVAHNIFFMFNIINFMLQCFIGFCHKFPTIVSTPDILIFSIK